MPICAQALNRQRKEILANHAGRFKKNHWGKFTDMDLTDFLGLVALWELNERGYGGLTRSYPAVKQITFGTIKQFNIRLEKARARFFQGLALAEHHATEASDRSSATKRLLVNPSPTTIPVQNGQPLTTQTFLATHRSPKKGLSYNEPTQNERGRILSYLLAALVFDFDGLARFEEVFPSSILYQIFSRHWD